MSIGRKSGLLFNFIFAFVVSLRVTVRPETCPLKYFVEFAVKHCVCGPTEIAWNH